MAELDIRSLLINILDSGKFPGGNVQFRHIDRIQDVEYLEGDKIRFCIERHPSIFSHGRAGLPSPGFRTERCIYELNTKTQELDIIDVEESPPVIDYKLLAEYEVEAYMENANNNAKFALINTEDELIQFAEKEYKSLCWIHNNDYWKADDMPHDFVEKSSAEIKKQFIKEMIISWKDYQEDNL
jgi:hypothetical protein